MADMQWLVDECVAGVGAGSVREFRGAFRRCRSRESVYRLLEALFPGEANELFAGMVWAALDWLRHGRVDLEAVERARRAWRQG